MSSEKSFNFFLFPICLTGIALADKYLLYETEGFWNEPNQLKSAVFSIIVYLHLELVATEGCWLHSGWVQEMTGQIMQEKSTENNEVQKWFCSFNKCWKNMLWTCLHTSYQWKNDMVYAKSQDRSKLLHWLLCWCKHLFFSITKLELVLQAIWKDIWGFMHWHFKTIFKCYTVNISWFPGLTEKLSGLLKILWVLCWNLHLVFH